MKKERFKSSMYLVYLALGAIAFVIYAGNYNDWTFNDYLEGVVLVLGLFLIVFFSTISTYLEIQDNRWLINSGYRTFGKDKIDIFDIKYIYRFPQFILKWYGSRMVFYIKTPDGKLRQSSQREINFSEDKLIQFLKRIKQLNPNIELDAEYEKILNGEMEKNNPSENTVASIEGRLKEKGEVWK